MLGGNDSGSTSSETSIPGSVSTTLASQGGGDLAGRAPGNIISVSTTTTSHTTSSSNPNSDGSNTGRIVVSLSSGTTGSSSNREQLQAVSTGDITMSTSSGSTVISSSSIAANDEDISQTSKPISPNNMVAGNTSSGVSSGSTGTITTSSLAACAGSSASTSASSSSYTDYRQIKRKLRSQVDDGIAAAVGNNGQQGNNPSSNIFSKALYINVILVLTCDAHVVF